MVAGIDIEPAWDWLRLANIGGAYMKKVVCALAAIAAVAGLLASIGLSYGQAAREAAPIFVDRIPSGYREWKLISVAHEEANLRSFAAVLGNDAAINAYRATKLPFPDGTIIAALHYGHVASEENNKAFGQTQSFVPGAPTNIQFMVKDSKRFAATGGWGFAHFKDGKAAEGSFMSSCFPCHNKAKASDFVFTRYAP
jgi:hypothetical protein